MQKIATAPIGIFDSGIGGLTVVREIAARLPQESLLYFGDTLRCPYGPRSQAEVRLFVQQISGWLDNRGVKLIVIACNTATAAGLKAAQGQLDIPVIGVVEPGARAAVQASRGQRIGVIATQGTVGSGVYEHAIHKIAPDSQVFSAAAPQLVEIAESGIRFGLEGQVPQAFYDEVRNIIANYLNPLLSLDIDTLVLGCTHYPLLIPLIKEVAGPYITLISSAEKTADDVVRILAEDNLCAPASAHPSYSFATTAANSQEFARLGSQILGYAMEAPIEVSLEELITV